MAEIIWSPAALEDAESIAEFISRDSIDAAALFIQRLFEAADHLRDFPRSGRKIPEIDDDLCREIIYGSYRVMYRIQNDAVWITAIVHGARNWRVEQP
ncbi:MAG: type II toxin-antitoxin system RelE/ParE family toxin [Spirochaetota bacterium]|jgi:toxin ParE1/3/4